MAIVLRRMIMRAVPPPRVTRRAVRRIAVVAAVLALSGAVTPMAIGAVADQGTLPVVPPDASPTNAVADPTASQEAAQLGLPDEAVDSVQENLGIDRSTANRRLVEEATATEISSTLASRLGVRFVGSYLAEDGASVVVSGASPAGLVVEVTDAAAAATVRQAGATAKVLPPDRPTPAAVDTALGGLAARMSIGSVVAWSVDLPTDTLLLTVRGSGTDAATKMFVAAAGRLAARPVRLETTDSDVAAAPSALYGGQEIDGSDRTACTAGFLTRDAKGRYAVLTAGHCADGRPVFGQRGRVIGSTLGYTFPGRDYALVSVDNPGYWRPQGGVMDWSRTRDIAGRTTPPVGATVCKSGRTSRTTCGPILRYGVTVNYGRYGKVTGLVEARLCVRPGDSGGPVWSGRYAQGIISGSLLNQGRCLVGKRARAFYQPVAPALAAYRVSLY
jgi:streptogrisin C